MRHFSVVFAFFLSFLFYSNGFSQNITVLAPNGGETLAGCSNYNIRWTATGTSNYFYIDYSVNNGTSWASLATNIQYNGGIFTWTVPNISSSQALIRVRDAVDTNIIDQSNAVFTITPALVLNSPNGGEVWQGGTYQNISWAVSAGSSTYQVEYSMNAGVTWTSIATTSNNSYYWLVPNTPTTTAMVRVRDINSTCRGDVSDNLFTITAATPSIVVNNPWQGAVWSISTSQTISWSNAYLPSSTVHVSLSLDSGLTWSRLYSNTATGTTSGSVSNWPVSNTPTTKAMIKVMASSDTTVVGYSGTFTIPPFFNVTAPNLRGTTWNACTNQYISFNKSASIGYVKLEYTLNGGQSWMLITASTYTGFGTTGSYLWSVPDLPSTTARIRVSDPNNATRFDISDNDFTIVGDTSIVLNSPIGGEVWQGGTSQVISWAGNNTVSGRYSVYYSTNNGQTWNTIVVSTYSTSISWTVPNLPTSTALIRVDDYNNSCKSGVSPAPFTITPASPVLTLTYPNGGEQLSPGSSISISWYSNYLTGSFVKLEYSVDSGANWTTIIGNTSLTTGSYAWTVPNIPTNRAWVRVSSTTQTQVMDTSNATFTINPFFTVTTPNGGQSWQGCSSQYIYFNKSSAIGYVKLDYSVDSGRTWNVITANTYVGYGTSGSYYWSPVPNIPTNSAMIRVSDPSVPSRFDVSDVVFQIIGDQSIVLNSPNGGETWQGGTYQTISWAGNTSVSGRYTVEYSINGGTTWTTLTSSTYSTSYYWLLPNLPTSSARIRVTDYFNTCKNAVSAQNFTITAATPQLYVTYPNGGEQLSPGSSVSISWYGLYLPASNFKIEYSADSGANWTVLSSVVSSTATSFAWTVPNANSSRMLVKVSLTSFPSIADTSNATFTVIPYFTVTTPNGGQSWQGCSSQYIYFNKSSAIGYVKLDYSLDSGLTWNVITANTYVGYGNSGSFYWSPVPNSATNNALIRVSDASVPTRFDVSDVVFQILGDQSIVINSPNGGETWQGGTYQTISWAGNTSVSGRYSLEYSINGGTTWTSITTSTYNNSFYWLVPNLPTSSARIRVTDYFNTCKNAVSAQNFTITAATPQLFITSPNGGEQLYPGTAVGIYWSNNYVPGSFVKLEYSTDSGANWTTIVTNTSLSSGFYNWSVPNIPTSRALVRISSSSLPNVMDTSNSVFTIRPFLTITSPGTPGLSYPSCSNQYIYFEKSPVITSVKVEYSTDSMGTWTTFSNSYYVGGSTSASIYWSVPSLFTNNLFLRVSDVNNPTTRLDVTDYPIVVRGDSSIVLNTPNGGETWQGGTYQNITWAGNATVSGRYQVEYSINNGLSWTLLTSSTYNTSYFWLLPNTPTTTARVRITDYFNTCKNAVSNQSFTITAASPTLTVNYPNGGEGLYPGTAVSISWSSSYLPTSNIKLEYSTNGGSNWTTISSSISSSTFNYSWTVPDAPTTQALVRISLTSFPQIADTSNNTFTIYPYFTVTTPNGGQSWQGCSYQYLYFNKSSALGYVKLDYSIDNGSTWNVISANTYTGYGTSASYYWQVPNQASSNALIRVSDPNVPSRFDVTDVPFTIVPDYAIALNAPLGGEQWRAGTYQTISWAGNNSVSGRYMLEYSTNGGVNWNTITTSVYGTSYVWLIPNLPTSQAVIRVSDFSNTCKQAINNIFFTILPGIPTYTVTTPNGGEVFYSGASSYIYWTSQYVTGSFTKIEYSLDSGRIWTTIVNATNNTGSYLWSSIPAVYTNQALIRISDYNNPSVTDVSNAVFTIRKPITVTAPDGMEFVGGCTYTTISFNRGGASNYIKMEYSLNNGVSWNIITASQYFATMEVNYNWLVPNLDGRNSCLVRVSDANNAAKFDVSDSTFTIFPAIRLIEPAYGGVFVGGTIRNITWWDTLTSDYYNIEYSLNNGSTWTIIAANTFIGNNTFAWTVPNIASTSALIRITDFQNTCKQSLTSISFSIAQVPNALTLNNPIGGNTYLACQVVPISWTASGTVGNVVLEYSANAGTSWVALATNQPNVGSYNWTVPNLNSNNYLIRVRDIFNSQIYDICNGTLRLVATQANAGSSKLICSGDSVRLDGTGNGSFAWTGNGLSQTNSASPWAKPIQTTTYQLTVTNVYGCTASSSTTVTVQGKPALQVTGATICVGTSSTISATGANTYTWTPSAGLSNASSSSPIANPNTTTTYQVIGTTNGCSDTESVVVTVNPIPANPIISNVGALTFCSGDSVLLNSSAATGNQWFLAGNAINGANQSVFYAKNTGTYSVRSTVNGCSASSASINVSVQPRPATPSISNARPLSFCSGDSVILTSSALAGNVWSAGANSRSIVVKTSGTYSVLVQGTGCSSGSTSVAVQVTQSPTAPTLTASTATTFCSGDSLRITSSTGTGMNWSTGATNVSSIVVRASGTISGYVVANGCSSAVSNAVAVTVNPTPSAPTITANRPTTFCQGDSVVISSTGTENKIWSNGAVGNSIVAKSNGVYSVRAFAVGCTSTVSNPISVLVNSIPATPTLTASTATTFCSGDSLRITSSTGTGMNWSTGATNVSSIVVRASGTISGYVVANGCSSSVSNAVAVTVNPTPSAPTITANRPTTFCQGDSVVISSTGTENKIWSNGAVGNSIVAKSNGVYSVRAFALGCTSTVSNPISVLVNSIPATPTLTASTATTFCSGDSLRITSSTGTGMNWSTGAANVSSIVVRNSGTISGYVVANGCSSAVSNAVAVTVNPTPSAPTITANRPTTFCQGDSVVISSTGTENKIWSNGAVGNSIVAKSSGVYSVRAFALGCTSTVSNPISVLVNSIPATPTLTASTATTFCSGDSLRITSSTGTGMNWSTGATNVSSIVVRASGTITGYVVANGCSSSVSNAVAVTVNPTPSAPTITANRPTTFCQGDSVVISSTGTDNKIWSNGAVGNSIVAKSNGVYLVRAYALGCTSTVSNPISVLVNSIPATPTLTASTATTFCSGDSLQITSSTGTGMNWSTGANNVSSIMVRASGTITGYVVANGCSSTVSNAVAVTVNPTPSAPTITSSRNPQFCLGDSVQLSFNGNGSPLWSNGSTQTSVWIYQSQVHTVQSILGSCTSSVSLPISVLVSPVPTAPIISSSSVSFCSNDSLLISSNVSQGMVWSTGATSSQIYVRSNNPIYGYVLQNGCASVFSNILQPTVITSPLAPTIVASGNTTFCQGDSVRVTSNSVSVWSTGDSTISIVVRNSGTFTARNQNQGCYSDPSNSIQVLVNPIPSAPVVAGRDTSFCQGDSVQLSITPSQGSIWNTGSTNSSIFVKNTGIYSAVRVALGCTSTVSNAIVITVNPRPLPPTISPTGSALTFCQGDSMVITSSALFGNTWNTGDTSSSIVIRNNLPYYVKSTNAFGCSSAFSSPVNATVHPVPAAPQVKKYAYTLVSDSLQVQWFLNGSPIPGAINSKFIIQLNGIYTCGVRNALNCWAYSTPIVVKDAVLGDVDIDKELLPTEKTFNGEFKFSVYPNPTNGQLNVLWRGEVSVGLLEVFDGSGRKVASKVRSNESQSTFNLEHLKPGMYWIRYSDIHHTETQKFIIQR